ncbi:hypothetical protein GBA52_016289 [Prunus armeniaca]|nr:hypothetical protein GBA52_016289 [Prunus armeniaca]
MAGKESESVKQGSQSVARKLPPSMNPVKTEPSPIVPYPGYSPIQITNRFTSLDSTVPSIRPNYESTLISSYDPLQVTTPPPSQPSISYKKSSPYLPRSNNDLFIVEPCYNSLSNPVKIAKAYFPPNHHFVPHHPEKSLIFYRDILFETQTLKIRPIKDRNDPNIILYHSMYIHKILSQSDWGDHPYSFKILKSNIQYSYYDYIEAWNNIFLHQNKDFSHSWFVNFDSKFRSPFPSWFSSWWEKHGPVIEILPHDLQDSVTYFTSKYKFREEDAFFHSLLIFVAKYKVPWILKWSYQVNWETRTLSRQISVKWWDRFNSERIIGQVYKEFPLVKVTQHKSSISEASQSSLPIEGRTKLYMKELARQLMIQVSQMSNDEDASLKSHSSQAASSNQERNASQKKSSSSQTKRCADSQDPNDLNED